MFVVSVFVLLSPATFELTVIFVQKSAASQRVARSRGNSNSNNKNKTHQHRNTHSNTSSEKRLQSARLQQPTAVQPPASADNICRHDCNVNAAIPAKLAGEQSIRFYYEYFEHPQIFRLHSSSSSFSSAPAAAAPSSCIHLDSK